MVAWNVPADPRLDRHEDRRVAVDVHARILAFHAQVQYTAPAHARGLRFLLYHHATRNLTDLDLVELSVGYVARGANISRTLAHELITWLQQITHDRVCCYAEARQHGYPVRPGKPHGAFRSRSLAALAGLRRAARDIEREGHPDTFTRVHAFVPRTPEAHLSDGRVQVHVVRVGEDGRPHTCLCPFHDDHHPSASLMQNAHGQSGALNCFVCGMGVGSWARATDGSIWGRKIARFDGTTRRDDSTRPWSRGSGSTSSGRSAGRVRPASQPPPPSIRSLPVQPAVSAGLASLRRTTRPPPSTTFEPDRVYEDMDRGKVVGSVRAKLGARGVLQYTWTHRSSLAELAWADRSGPVAETDAWRAAKACGHAGDPARAHLPQRMLSTGRVRATRLDFRDLRYPGLSRVIVKGVEASDRTDLLFDIDHLDLPHGRSTVRWLLRALGKVAKTAPDLLVGDVSPMRTPHGLQVWMPLLQPVDAHAVAKGGWLHERYLELARLVLAAIHKHWATGGTIDTAASNAGQAGRLPGWSLIDDFGVPIPFLSRPLGFWIDGHAMTSAEVRKASKNAS